MGTRLINSKLTLAGMIGLIAACGGTKFQSVSTTKPPLAVKTEPVPNETDANAKLPAGEIANVRASIDGKTLGSQSVVMVDWDTKNPGSLQSSSVFWRKKDGAWSEITNAVKTDTGISFVYGDKNIGPFDIKVVGVQKNKVHPNTEGETKWLPSVFQSAILTRTVQCLFCHIRVEGDVGGIDFPASGVHQGSGTGLNILGKLYATNLIPDLLKKRATGGDYENYKNTEKHIFPVSYKFPVLAPETLSAKMQGSIKGGAIQSRAANVNTPVTSITKTFKGNLILDGKTAPLLLSGEVFVDGDVVIRGKYKGVGTIYARNIFIVDDLVAVSSPFPFAAQEKEAVEKARKDISKGSDALYLAALNDVIVGYQDHNLNGNQSIGGITTNTSYSWLPKDQYTALGSALLTKSDFKMEDGSPATWNPATDVNRSVTQLTIDVARIDAYIYGGRSFIWRSYANSLLNGGFMSPNSAILSRIQVGTGANWNPCDGRLVDSPTDIPTACGKRMPLINPRNGLPTHTNVIRFDYRLSAGIPGLESLKEFFAP